MNAARYKHKKEVAAVAVNLKDKVVHLKMAN
jgi:hypothetical protein